MFKVSFKDTPRDPSKIVVRAGNKISVLLKGTVALPEFFKYIPESIIAWMTEEQKLISGEEDIANNIFHLKVSGHVLCHKDDTFDYVLGERLAEARAKYKMYRFFHTLILKLCTYYSTILYGSDDILATQDGGLLKELKKYERLMVKEAQHLQELLKETKNG